MPESRRLAVILRVTLKAKPLASEIWLGEDKILLKNVVYGSEEALPITTKRFHQDQIG